MSSDENEPEKNNSDAMSIKSLRSNHINELKKMITKNANKVKSSHIRGTDIPTEYFALFAFVVIATIGVCVGLQVKKKGSALPMASYPKRND